jgi:formamidase
MVNGPDHYRHQVSTSSGREIIRALEQWGPARLGQRKLEACATPEELMEHKPDHYIGIDRGKSLGQEPAKGHNRWHPDIPPILTVESGQTLGLETRDALDGQISSSTSAVEAGRANLNVAHPLTGPIYIRDAEPGDILEITVLDIEPQPFGFTAQIPGFGFLRDIFTEPHIIHWDIRDGFATSIDLPRVKIPGEPFMGVIGLAPSHELLDRINRRESDLSQRGGNVLLPDAADAVPASPAIAHTAMRTIAPHETGGNLDVKQLTKGTTVRIPVYLAGGLFSVGDAHFAQGDNECCGTAIEMGATFYCSFRLVKGAAAARNIRDVQFYRTSDSGPSRALGSYPYFATTGQSYTRDGVNHSEDATLAARNALLNMIDYLVDGKGYTPQQAYSICSVAVDLHISEVVDVPNFVVSAFLPLDIFTE